MTTETPVVPDAIAAVVAGVLENYPAAPAWSLGRLIVAELRAQGWRIAAPEGRDSTNAPSRS